MEYGTTDDTHLNGEISEYLQSSCADFFGRKWGNDPEGRDGRVKREWTGIMAVTADGMPFVGEVPGRKGMWICAGFMYGE